MTWKWQSEQNLQIDGVLFISHRRHKYFEYFGEQRNCLRYSGCLAHSARSLKTHWRPLGPLLTSWSRCRCYSWVFRHILHSDSIQVAVVQVAVIQVAVIRPYFQADEKKRVKATQVLWQYFLVGFHRAEYFAHNAVGSCLAEHIFATLF